MIAWILYAVAVSTLLTAAAALAEKLQAWRGWPTRWPWVVALGTSVFLPLFMGLRGGRQVVEVPATVVAQRTSGVVAGSASWWSVIPDWASASSLIPWGWGLISAGLVLTLLVGVLRLRMRARRWPSVRLPGGTALVSEDFGPATIGSVFGRVVLPRWALGLGRDRVEMILTHEEEHRRTGDVALLTAGAALVVLFPWNPLLWVQLRRLRSAVELDCDHRVLARGIPARPYAELLLEMGTRPAGHLVSWAALAATPSLLERRLKMIVRGGTRGSIRASVFAAAAAGALVFVACDTEAPPLSPETAAEEVEAPVLVEGILVDRKNLPLDRSAEFKLQDGEVVVGQMKLSADRIDYELHTDGPNYFLDGEPVDNLDGITPDQIDRIEVIKSTERGEIHVYRKDDNTFYEERPSGDVQR